MRPHMSHVDGNALPWVEILNTGAKRKQLSVDPDTGSDTSFVRIPRGWRGPAGAHYHTGFEEAMILTGDVDLNGNDLLVNGSYLYRPGPVRTPPVAVLVAQDQDQDQDGLSVLLPDFGIGTPAVTRALVPDRVDCGGGAAGMLMS